MLDGKPDSAEIDLPEGRQTMKQSCCSQCIQFTVGFLLAIVVVNTFTFVTIFGLVAPEKDAWVGTLPSSNEPSLAGYEKTHQLFATEAEAEQAGATSVSNVHFKFWLWSLVGFYAFAASIALGPLCMPCYKSSNSCGRFLSLIIYTLLSLTLLTWWVVGLLLRFCTQGRFASGDIPPEGMRRESWIETIKW